MNQVSGVPRAAAEAPVAAPPSDRPARLADLIALNRRFTALADSLKPIETAVLGAAEDRGAVEARLASVERALNSLEGEICIRLEPRLRAALAAPSIPARRGHPFLVATLVAAGVALGAAYAEPLRTGAAQVIAIGLDLASR